MSSIAKITLRPPPHRDYLHGYPGIPACDPSTTDSTACVDPLFPSLVVQSRPQAHLSGTVEVRAPSHSASHGNNKKGGSKSNGRTDGEKIKAKWLRIELEKIETLPSPVGATGIEAPTGKKKDAATNKREVRFVELIGVGPGTLWSKEKRSGAHDSDGDEDDSDAEWDYVNEGNYPFRIPIPEGLPPSSEIDSRGTGISYQLVASLYGQEEKSGISFFGKKKASNKKGGKPVLVNAVAHILLLKADILPAWPAFAPVLPGPTPADLPWTPVNGFVTGQMKDVSLNLRADHSSTDGTSEGEIWMRAYRQAAAYGPGDAINLKVEMGWRGASPLKIARLDCILRETIIYKYPQGSATVRSTPKVNIIATASADTATVISGPTATKLAILYPDESRSFELVAQIPGNHSRVTIRTAKYIDVAYHMKIAALVDGGNEVSIDNWSVIIGAVDSREAKGLVQQIGWAEGLCFRPGIARPQTAQARVIETRRATPRKERPLSEISSLPSDDGGTALITRAQHAKTVVPTPVRRVSIANLVEEFDEPLVASSSTQRPAYNATNYAPEPSSSSTLRAAPQQEQRRPSVVDPAATPPPPIADESARRPLNAEEEKRRLFDHARVTAEAQQQQLAHSTGGHFRQPSAGSSLLSRSLTTAEQEKIRLHQQAAEKRDELQRLARKARESIASSNMAPSLDGSQVPSDGEKRLYHEAARRRAELQSTLYESGPVNHMLGIASSDHDHGPTSERMKTIEAAKAAARRAQEQARLELERQAALLAQIEAEEENARHEEEARRRHEEIERQRQQQLIEAAQAQARAEEEQRRAAAEAAAERQRHEQARMLREREEDERRREYEREQARLAEEAWRRDQVLREEAAARERQERLHAERAVRERQAQELAAREEQLRREREQLETERAELQLAMEAARNGSIGSAYSGPRSFQPPHPSMPMPMSAENQPLAIHDLQSSRASSQSYGRSQAASPAAFAPVANLDQATADFYTQAISQSSALARTASLAHQPSMSRSHAPQPHYAQVPPAHHVSMASAPSAPSQRARYITSIDGEEYSFSPVSPLRVNGVSLVDEAPSVPQRPSFASAAASQHPTAPPLASAPSIPTTDGSEAEENDLDRQASREQVKYGKRAVVEAEADDSLPIYATGNQMTADAARQTLSAQEEKARIDQFYQRAKAEVEAHTNGHRPDLAPPAPPRARRSASGDQQQSHGVE